MLRGRAPSLPSPASSQTKGPRRPREARRETGAHSAYVSRAGSARPAAPVQPRGTLARGRSITSKNHGRAPSLSSPASSQTKGPRRPREARRETGAHSAYVSRAGSARPAAPVQPRGTLGRGDRRHLEISKNATNVDNSLYSILLRRTPAGGRAPPPSAIGPTPPPRSQRAPSALPRHSAEIATPGALAVRRGRQTGHPKSASRPRRPPSGAVPGAVPRRSSPGRRPRRGPGTTKGSKARPVERSAAALRAHGRAGCCCFAA